MAASVVWPVVPAVEAAVADVLMLHFADDEDAYNAAAAVVADPAIVVRRRRVIAGEWQAVAAALDELPAGTVILWQAESDRWVAIKDLSRMGDARWFEAGVQRPRSSESIARDGAPIEVLV